MQDQIEWNKIHHRFLSFLLGLSFEDIETYIYEERDDLFGETYTEYFTLLSNKNETHKFIYKEINMVSSIIKKRCVLFYCLVIKILLHEYYKYKI